MRKYLEFVRNITWCLVIVCLFYYGLNGLVTFALPLKHGDYRTAITSSVADQAEVLIVGANDEYQKGNYADATRALELALEKLVDKSGHYAAADKPKLERIYFLLGKIHQQQKAIGKAKESYQETLRLNPNNWDAKYNLEMLEAQGGGGGGGGKQPQPTDGQIQPKI